MADPFVDPVGSGGEKFDFKEHLGRLVMIEPKKIEHNVTTQNGTSDAVVADVTAIDAPGGVVEVVGAFIFTTAIKGKVEDHLGLKVLGRVIAAQSMQGRPYPDLQPASDQDKQLAGQYVAQRDAQRQANQFAQPAQQQNPPPQASGWPQAQPQQPPAQNWPQQPPAQTPSPQQGTPPGWPQQQSEPPF